MALFKIVVVAVGLVFTLGFINASSIPDQLNLKYNPAVAENDEEAMVDFQTLLLIAQSFTDSKMTAPQSCKCEGMVCHCCKTIKIFKWKKNACVEVQYKKEDSSFGIKFTFGSRSLFSGTKPATGGAPACFKHRSLLGVKVCLDVTDFKSEEGDKTHGCVSASAKLIDETVTFRMGCFDMAPAQKEPSALTYYDSDLAAVAENDEEAMVDFQTLLLIARSFTDSKMTAPASCKCEGIVCNCCKTLKIFKWTKDACVEVEYKKEGSLFGIRVSFGNKELFNGTQPATGGKPTCLKRRYLVGVKLCAKVENFKSEGNKVHGCAYITATLGKTATFPMDCFDLTPEQKDDSALTNNYYSDPGEEPEEIEPSTGWVESEENDPLPDEDYLIKGTYDE